MLLEPELIPGFIILGTVQTETKREISLQRAYDPNSNWTGFLPIPIRCRADNLK